MWQFQPRLHVGLRFHVACCMNLRIAVHVPLLGWSEVGACTVPAAASASQSVRDVYASWNRMKATITCGHGT